MGFSILTIDPFKYFALEVQGALSKRENLVTWMTSDRFLSPLHKAQSSYCNLRDGRRFISPPLNSSPDLNHTVSALFTEGCPSIVNTSRRGTLSGLALMCKTVEFSEVFLIHSEKGWMDDRHVIPWEFPLTVPWTWREKWPIDRFCWDADVNSDAEVGLLFPLCV